MIYPGNKNQKKADASGGHGDEVVDGSREDKDVDSGHDDKVVYSNHGNQVVDGSQGYKYLHSRFFIGWVPIDIKQVTAAIGVGSYCIVLFCFCLFVTPCIVLFFVCLVVWYITMYYYYYIYITWYVIEWSGYTLTLLETGSSCTWTQNYETCLLPKMSHIYFQSSFTKCSYSYTNVNITVHIKSAINVHTVVANINGTVHIK